MNTTELSISKTSIQKMYPTDMEDVTIAIRKAEENLAYSAKATLIFRKDTDFAWDAHVFNEEGLCRNLSKVSAQLKSKRDALVSARLGHIKANAAVAAAIEKADNLEVMPGERFVLLAEANELKTHLVTSGEYIIACGKDVSKLTARYREIEALIIDKHGKFDEEVVELEENESWLKTLCRQSLRDVRQFNHITKGEQEALENMGLDPYAVMNDHRLHLNETVDLIEKGGVIMGGHLENYVQKFADKYADAFKGRLKSRKLSTSLQKDHLFIEEMS